VSDPARRGNPISPGTRPGYSLGMSYDLEVYTPARLDADGLRALVGAVSGLAVDAAAPESVTVVRGARRAYSFTVDGPFGVEPEDVPPEVTGVLLGAGYLYTVLVEGSSAREIPHARRFARRLATTLDGAVFDQQTGEVWSRSTSRTVSKPRMDTRIATVELNWYCRRADVPTDAAERVLASVGRHLPEALPRRYGEYEPFQAKLADGGVVAFCAAWRAATDSLHFSCTAPAIGGSLDAGPNERFPDRFWGMSLTLFADPLREPAWRAATRGLFTSVADTLGAFHATAEVVRDSIWSGRSLWVNSKTEPTAYLLHGRSSWLGLSPVPLWWYWFGPPYASFTDALPADRRTATATGTLFEAAVLPTTRDRLPPLTTWLPEDLFGHLEPKPEHSWPGFDLSQAPTIPAELA
jgi:hypothetical protein